MGKVPWLQIESAVREALGQYARGEILAISAVRLIDEAFAIGTRRGNELPEKPFEWEPSADFNPKGVEEQLRKHGLAWEVKSRSRNASAERGHHG